MISADVVGLQSSSAPSTDPSPTRLSIHSNIRATSSSTNSSRPTRLFGSPRPELPVAPADMAGCDIVLVSQAASTPGLPWRWGIDLFLVQHGEAKSEAEDPERSLTDRGAEAVRRMAAWAARVGVKVDQIRHSGKRRA